MYIGFTGHRNREASNRDLEAVFKEFPDATWVHGGAIGFDTQVADYAREHQIPQIVYRPDYTAHGRDAPFVRNITIVDQADFMVACYDGRPSGGTRHAIGYAQHLGKIVRVIYPIE